MLFTALSVFAQMVHVDDFSSEVFSKIKKKPVPIAMSLVFEGRYVKDEGYKIVDALNVVVGSFYFEDLITSQGKENLKKAIIAYCSKKYSVDIDNIYIQKINSQPSIKEIIDALKKEGVFIKN